MEAETRIKEIIRRGKPVDLEMLKRLRQTWIETYLGLNIIVSTTEDPLLEDMKMKLAIANEAVGEFFDVKEKIAQEIAERKLLQVIRLMDII